MPTVLLRRAPAGSLAVLAVLVLLFTGLLAGCEKGASSRCSGVDPHECTYSVDSTDDGWATRLETNRTHTEMTLSATVSIESGSGVVYVEGGDELPVEHPITADSPVTITDLVVPLKDGRRPGSDSYVILGIAADGDIEGIHAEVSYTSHG